MIFAIGSDQGGYQLKEEISRFFDEKLYFYKDYGTFKYRIIDYPDVAQNVCEEIRYGECRMGILICRTGIGVTIAANRFKNIRAALCFNEHMAEMARRHNNANVLCLGQEGSENMNLRSILKTFINTPFDEGRHILRLEKIDNINE